MRYDEMTPAQRAENVSCARVGEWIADARGDLYQVCEVDALGWAVRIVPVDAGGYLDRAEVCTVDWADRHWGPLRRVDTVIALTRNLQAQRRAALALDEAEQFLAFKERMETVRALPQAQHTALQQGAAQAAAAARARIAGRLRLPEPTGTDRQVAWAEEVRSGCITRLLDLIIGMPDGTLAYRIRLRQDNPLRLQVHGPDEYPGEDELVDAVNAALRSRECRTAAWWIGES